MGKSGRACSEEIQSSRTVGAPSPFSHPDAYLVGAANTSKGAPNFSLSHLRVILETTTTSPDVMGIPVATTGALCKAPGSARAGAGLARMTWHMLFLLPG